MLKPEELLKAMQGNNLAVLSVLADIGNGEGRDQTLDLPMVHGKDHPVSTPDRIIHWDAEFHFDPKGVTFDQDDWRTYHPASFSTPRGLLPNIPIPSSNTLENRMRLRELSTCNFCRKMACPNNWIACQPLEYPVEVALGMADFIMEDVRGGETAIAAYYRLLNCGFRPGLAAGTDFPCNDTDNPASAGNALTVGLADRHGWNTTGRMLHVGVKRPGTLPRPI